MSKRTRTRPGHANPTLDHNRRKERFTGNARRLKVCQAMVSRLMQNPDLDLIPDRKAHEIFKSIGLSLPLARLELQRLRMFCGGARAFKAGLAETEL